MKLNGHTPLVKATDVAAALDNGDGIARVMRKLYPLVVEAAFGDASLAGIPVVFDLENEYVQTVLDRLAKDVRRVAESTKDEIRALIGKQASERWSSEELADRIGQLAEVRSKTRAMMIARTETASAYSQGSLAAYRASGVVEQTEWLIGSEPCPDCGPLAGKRVALDDEFAPGIAFPPAHPMCTCSLSPVITSDE